MARPVALCGTSAGYYRHIRTLSEPACEDCKDAHRVAERLRAAEVRAAKARGVEREKKPPRLCDCGRRMLSVIGYDQCCFCRKTNTPRAREHMFNPTEDPIGWRREGLIWKPVWADGTQVA